MLGSWWQLVFCFEALSSCVVLCGAASLNEQSQATDLARLAQQGC